MLALVLGLLIASPQLWMAWRYYPHSIRSGKTAAQKMELGNIPLWIQLRNMVWPSVEPIDGVFGPEACTFIGLPALLCAFFAGYSGWWIVLGLSVLLSMGKHTPLFGWTHALHLRIPARYCYFVGLSLGMLAVVGFRSLAPPFQQLVLLVQSLHLILTLPRLWPMSPYVQRWEQPSEVFNTPLTRFLAGKSGRVSGLPYPLRTGQINQIHTLGYNGGSQAAWMARLRQDPNPNGSGGHDWFSLNEDGPLLDWYGVRYVYTYRPLSGKWQPTSIPHLYENLDAHPPPSWNRLANDEHLR